MNKLVESFIYLPFFCLHFSVMMKVCLLIICEVLLFSFASPAKIPDKESPTVPHNIFDFLNSFTTKQPISDPNTCRKKAAESCAAGFDECAEQRLNSRKKEAAHLIPSDPCNEFLDFALVVYMIFQNYFSTKQEACNYARVINPAFQYCDCNI